MRRTVAIASRSFFTARIHYPTIVSHLRVVSNPFTLVNPFSFHISLSHTRAMATCEGNSCSLSSIRANATASKDFNAAEYVNKEVNSRPIVVFSLTTCPYCVKVDGLFKSLNATSHFINVDQHANGSDIRAALLTSTGQRTVPNVFIGGKHIGGSDDTHKLHDKGELVPLIAAANDKHAKL